MHDYYSFSRRAGDTTTCYAPGWQTTCVCRHRHPAGYGVGHYYFARRDGASGPCPIAGSHAIDRETYDARLAELASR
jgi:hypothetical protein